jgi:hypothetical protein
MEVNKSQLWIDLKDFNAELKVLKGNPFRDHRLCIVMNEKEQFRNLIGNLQKRFPQQHIEETLAKAGFSLQDSINLINLTTRKDDSYILLGLKDKKQSVAVDELKILYPTLSSTNIERVDQNTITNFQNLFEDNTVEWQNFLKTKYFTEFNNVYYVNQLDEFDTNIGNIIPNPELDIINFNVLKFFDSLGINWQNSIKIFTSKEDALKTGYDESQITKGSLPFTVPLIFDKVSQSIIALKDIRNVVDLAIARPHRLIHPVHCASFPVTTAKFFSELNSDIVNFANQIDNDFLQKNELFKSLIKKYKHYYEQEKEKIFLGFSSFDIVYDNDYINIQASILSALEKITFQKPELKPAIEHFIQNYGKANTSEFYSDEVLMKVETENEININNFDGFEKSENYIDDVGEKIGGARKDIYNLKEINLNTYSDIEKKILIIKKNIWPKINFQQLKEDGYDIKVVLAIKRIKDAIKSKPVILDVNRVDDFYFNYIKAVSLIRDNIFSTKSWEQFPNVKKKLLDRLDDHLLDQIGMKAHDFLRVYGNAIGLENDIEMLVKRLYAYDFDPWDDVIKRKTGKINKNNTNKINEKKQQAEDNRLVERILHYPHLAHVERTVIPEKAKAYDWRHGNNITAQDLIDTFGFRGIEFGNWLVQKERQVVVNMAYDSFCDLAKALNFERHEISLNGELAISFGSRGTGGKYPALATYDPVLNVINLTRLNGAGALAHEWFHAFDRAILAHKIESGEKKFMSHKITEENYTATNPLYGIDEVLDVVKAMKEKKVTLKEIHNYDVERMVNHLAFLIKKSVLPKTASNIRDVIMPEEENLVKFGSKLKQYLFEFFKINNTLIKEAYKIFKREGLEDMISPQYVLDYIHTSLHISQEFKSSFKSKEQFHNDLKEIISTCLDIHSENIELDDATINMCYIQVAKLTLDICDQLDRLIDESSLANLKMETKFLSDARHMDNISKRRKSYWMASFELFARSGAAYVTDRLIELGISNNYLVAGAEENRLFNCAHSLEQFSPNPLGQERKNINQIITNLLKFYQNELINTKHQEYAHTIM